MFFDYYDGRIVMDIGNPEVEKAFSIFFNFNTGFGGMGETYAVYCYANIIFNVWSSFLLRD